jgi:hypothetical protein
MATTKPSKQFTDIEQGGRKALGLAKKHAKEVGDRLPSGLVTGLEEDVDQLKGLIAGATTARAKAKAATASQAKATAGAWARISAVRTAVARSGASKAVQKAYGVGGSQKTTSVKHAVSGLQQIIDRATANPEEARSLGILSADVTALRASLKDVLGADATQEDLRAAAPATTRERNAAARRVQAAVDRIAGAGVLAFADKPAIRSTFEALIGHGARKKKKPAKK